MFCHLPFQLDIYEEKGISKKIKKNKIQKQNAHFRCKQEDLPQNACAQNSIKPISNDAIV